MTLNFIENVPLQGEVKFGFGVMLGAITKVIKKPAKGSITCTLPLLYLIRNSKYCLPVLSIYFFIQIYLEATTYLGSCRTKSSLRVMCAPKFQCKMYCHYEFLL